MCKSSLALRIREKAVELGFAACGIIKLDAIKGYAEKLEERMDCLPETRSMYEVFLKYATPEQSYGWAKSVVVCITRYGKYKVPENLEGLIGKYYLYDYKLQGHTREFQNHARFEEYLKSLNLKTARELHGVTAARWVAAKAGLGIIRKNNFLYTEHGSWVIIDTWLIDEELELIEEPKIPDCPEGCSECVQSCPTQALTQSYCTSMLTCITRLTWGIKDLPPEDLWDKMGKWVYGCDECQNACPMNYGKWEATDNYPGLGELAEKLSLESIVAMDNEELKNQMLSKFWFIRQETVYQWKVNALRAMANSYESRYEKYIIGALSDENAQVREIAKWACAKNKL
ncbi:epoxyqueuosine reductase [Sporomusa malonica]|uniref:Epoxyqueuosine reductase QueG (Queuosine biosynthesis) n=1 Tax=Sporomusa malonica TaxID=112901 RepID=A0A1W2CXI6_9FIRM|nr:4Fe-4S double cluster binding domain-containing protein [Sporomusa malonica]SMC89933.1 Epoxyqueuosine reductase QueG (queuosine biosynthesis) [Sporomusa malonica]